MSLLANTSHNKQNDCEWSSHFFASETELFEGMKKKKKKKLFEKQNYLFHVFIYDSMRLFLVWLN